MNQLLVAPQIDNGFDARVLEQSMGRLYFQSLKDLMVEAIPVN